MSAIRSGPQPPAVPETAMEVALRIVEETAALSDRRLVLSMAKQGRLIYLGEAWTPSLHREAQKLEREGVLRHHSQDLQCDAPWIRYVLNPDWGL